MVNGKLSVVEKILVFLQEKNKCPGVVIEFSVKEIFTALNLPLDYKALGELNGLGLIRFENWKVSLLEIENNEEECDILSFFKTLTKLGLTNTDMKVLAAKGENPEEIAREKGLLINEVRRHKTNILIRLDAKDLKSARRKFERVTKRILA